MDVAYPPKGLAILALVGPAFIWCAEYIGSGEVILATRTGAILGNPIIWAVFIGIFLKYWIGMSGARYTVCTGEGMIRLYVVMPKLFNEEARQILKPHWIFAVGLIIAFLVFAYFCVFQIPYIL